MKRALKLGAIVAGVVLLAIQFVRPERTNPVTDPAATFQAVVKPHPEFAGVVQRACADCHSNTTAWPWYSHVAPVSWLVTDDVRRGRVHLNFSEWSFYGDEMSAKRLKAVCEEVRKGEMPPWYYRLAHRNARLGPSDVSVLCSATGQSARLSSR